MATLFRVKALFDYSSPHEDDLTFDAGQVINVTEQDDDDWYGGEYVDANGAKQEGIFPRNFVEKIEPAAPPRPSRPRPKKADATEAEQDPEPAPQRAASPPPPPPPADPVPEPEPEPEPTEEDEEEEGPLSPVQSRVAAPPPKAPVAAPAADPVPESPAEPQRAPAQAPPPAAATKPKAAGPPPVKPKSNAFKDRIAAFNKADAAPIIPFKPGGTGTDSFVKKPFVPPPPSRHAYVPPPTSKEPAPISAGYRREEDPEIQKQENENLEQAEKAGLLPSDLPKAEDAEDEDQPKPTSLKERIALLQKQQLEQAQRHADAAAKKEKAKKPPAPKKRADPPPPPPAAAAEAEEGETEAAPLQRTDTETTVGRGSVDEPLRSPPPPRRKSSKSHTVESPHDGNEADMSGAGDTTEGQDDASDHDDADEVAHVPIARVPTSSSTTQRQAAHEETGAADEEEEEEEEEEEDDVDPEVRRKEELRARMAKMSGGMGFHGMFGAAPPIPPVSAPKKKSSKTEKPAASRAEEEDSTPARAAPPVPTPMALPGLGLGGGAAQTRDEDEDQDEDEAEEAQPRALPTRPPPPPVRPPPAQEEEEDEDEDEEEVPTPHATDSTRQVPPVPTGRPAPPPVPSEARPPPPPRPAEISATEGSQSDDELSSSQREKRRSQISAGAAHSPTLPPAPARPLQDPTSPPLSPRGDESNKRTSRLPPPIPGSAAPPPPPSASRPPPPPPPGDLSRSSTADTAQAPPPIPSSGPPPLAGEDADAEVTEYEGDYDTDIASSVPHKDALKAHAREPSADDTLHSPETPGAPPPLPPQSPRGVPPPLPSQPPPQPKRTSVDAPRAAPPPPPPAGDEQGGAAETGRGQARKTPRIEEEAYFTAASPSVPQSPGFDRRVPPTTPGGTRHASRQSTDAQRISRRSTDMHRPSLDSGFIANDIDLGAQSGWWKQANQLPPYFQGRRDIYFETTESTTTNQGAKTVITREIFVLYQDYSQTIITVQFDPYDPSDVQLDQRHDPPPRPLRQDEMEEFYDRFGRQISETATSKKDSIVGDGTPHSLVHELLRPLNGALAPIGTRSFGALVYSNMANASTQQNDVIRPGDIMSVRNGKFQGKHGPMHAKYSAEVGKPDHVAVVAEWDGTKKKVRAWEQGRENKKVKVESYKLDDLRSGEVKIWRVVPRSWVGWNSQP